MPLPLPTLMLVTDCKLVGGDDALVAKVRAAVTGGVNVVQLREKDISQMQLVVLATRLREAIAGRAKLIVNGSPDVAEAVEADGVHLPEGDSQRIASGGTNKRMMVGRSVHSVEAARLAQGEGVDYVVVGPIYETATHEGRAPAGVGLLSDVAAAVSVPVIAIGGIAAEHVRELMISGASGVAVISAILGADDAEAAARKLWDALKQSRAVTAG